MHTKKNFLFYLGHPAHFHLFKVVMKNLKNKGHNILILIKKKDILEELLKRDGWDYININPRGRADNKLAIAWNLLMRDWEFIKIARRYKPNLMIGTSAEIAHAGRLLKIPSIVVNEDDASIVPLFAKLAYPFASHILAPDVCDVGKWNYKKIAYPSYHELAYLHPDHFIPNEKLLTGIDLSKPFFIIRFAKLGAHHDGGRTGITTAIAEKICTLLAPHGNIYISSERELEPQFEKYRIKINPLHMHHAMYFAAMYIGDSQTMAAEAAVLGTPSIRFNDFVGEIGYLEDLEHKYNLTFGIRTHSPDQLYLTIEALLAEHQNQSNKKHKLERLLKEKINAAAYMETLFENYPKFKV
ncbi:MAG: hypothetical protein RIQ89_2168 [Bacteroidota bacterium]|jgi:predicted glycosyltransferase